MFKKIAVTIFFGACVFASTSEAWIRYYIPGAICGDGLPYSVFVENKPKANRLSIEFMGGGACWSASTCYGPNIHTWIHPIPTLPFYSLLTSPSLDNPYKSASKIYFPYCTGDVFTGNHTEAYLPFVNVHHMGYNNVLKALDYLSKKKVVNFQKYPEVFVWGASAGAIGALTHAKNIEKYVNPMATKILLADSPGLHFGKTFWQKFTPEQMVDFVNAFGNVSLNINPNDGMVAPHMGPFFKRMSNWFVGVMQSTLDPVMSIGFGEITPEEHQKAVLGPDGIVAIAKPFTNVGVWIPELAEHTFLLLDSSAHDKNPEGISAIEFTKNMIFTAHQMFPVDPHLQSLAASTVDETPEVEGEPATVASQPQDFELSGIQP